MRIERLALRPYRLPLERPWQTARGLVRQRLGWLLQVWADGECGYGDCAPWPQAGTEGLRSARRCLGAYQRQLPGRALDAAWDGATVLPRCPAAQFAVETALLDLRARLAGLPLRRLLAATAGERVAVNAALGALDAGVEARLAAAAAAGYRVFKLKVGLDAVPRELRRLRDLARLLPPHGMLRLDANGAWQPDAARTFIDGAAALPVEALEEPLAEPDHRGLRQLQADCPFALALDESLPRYEQSGQHGRFPVRRLVLKPGVVGGLLATRRRAQAAAAAGVEVVITSLLESAAGVWAALQLAATLPGDLAHGLATSSWLADDLGQAPEVVRGSVALPTRPGSGFCPTGGWFEAAQPGRAQ